MEENSLSVSAQIEAILFYKNEPTKLEELSNILKLPIEQIESSVDTLSQELKGRGVTIVCTERDVALQTSSEASELINSIRKQEISGELGKAALETLSLVLYRGPITRAGIDYIRGVNSQFILRRLSVRGLIEKQINPENKQGFIYHPSVKLLSHLGISDLKELPEYAKVQESLQKITPEIEREDDGGEVGR